MRSRSGGKDARARRARAHLRVLLWGPLLLLNSRVDLVSPSLGALLAGLTGQLGRDERPSVAVNFLRHVGEKKSVNGGSSRRRRARRGGREGAGLPLRFPTNNPAPRKKKDGGRVKAFYGPGRTCNRASSASSSGLHTDELLPSLPIVCRGLARSFSRVCDGGGQISRGGPNGDWQPRIKRQQQMAPPFSTRRSAESVAPARESAPRNVWMCDEPTVSSSRLKRRGLVQERRRASGCGSTTKQRRGVSGGQQRPRVPKL